MFERGVINVFKELSWDYKTNSPCKFGSKIIVNNLVRWDQWGFHLISGMQADRLADLERMLHLLSGKPIPDNRGNITINLDDHIQSVQGKGRYEDEMFIIKYFKKGCALSLTPSLIPFRYQKGLRVQKRVHLSPNQTK